MGVLRTGRGLRRAPCAEVLPPVPRPAATLDLGVGLGRRRFQWTVETGEKVSFACFLRELDVDRPRLDGDELAYFLLPVDHQAQRHRRDSTGADSLLDLAPQERAEPEPDQA